MAISQERQPGFLGNFGSTAASGLLQSNLQNQRALLETALLSKRMEMELANRKAEMEYQSQLQSISPEAFGGAAHMLGATPEQLGPFQSAMAGQRVPFNLADVTLKGLSTENARKAMMAVQEIPLIDEQSGIPLGKELRNGLGITTKRVMDPNAKSKLDEYGKLEEFKKASQMLYDAYNRVYEQRTGTGPFVGKIKELNPYDPDIQFMKRHGKGTLGQFTQFLEKVPGSRMSLNLAKLAQESVFSPTMPKETADMIKSAYDSIYQERLERLRSGVVTSSSSKTNKAVYKDSLGLGI